MSNSGLLPRLLFFLGAGFLVLNVRLFAQALRYRRLRRHALLTWPPPRPPLYRLFLWVGALLGVLIVYKLAVLRLYPTQVFGESMMLVYYVYAMPLSVEIRRGFYEEGIWTDTGYVQYSRVGGLTWREGPPVMLVVMYRWKNFARRLTVPQPLFGEARRVLRDKIATHDIHFTGKTLDLGAHDERDDV